MTTSNKKELSRLIIRILRKQTRNEGAKYEA